MVHDISVIEERAQVKEHVSESDRICWYDNIKFILITLVAVGHFIDKNTADSQVYRGLFLFIYTFHMPLFLFISGIFHKEGHTAKRAVSYLSIGIALQIFRIILPILWGKAKPTYAFLSEVSVPWFMYVLAGYEIFMWAVKDIDRKKLLICSIIFACFVGYDPSIGDYLQLSRSIVFMPFYLAGTMLSPETLRKTLKRKKEFAYIGALILLLWGLACLKIPKLYSLRPLFTGRNPFSKKFLPWGCLYRLACMVITTLTSLGVLCLVPTQKIPVLSEFGRRTLQVYFYHRAVCDILWRYGLGPMLMDNPSGKLVWIALAVATALLTSTKLFAYPIRWLRF